MLEWNNLFRSCDQVNTFLIISSRNIFNGKNFDHKTYLGNLALTNSYSQSFNDFLTVPETNWPVTNSGVMEFMNHEFMNHEIMNSWGNPDAIASSSIPSEGQEASENELELVKFWEETWWISQSAMEDLPLIVFLGQNCFAERRIAHWCLKAGFHRKSLICSRIYNLRHKTLKLY